ncbi:MAG: hypothetical protein IPJ60_00725 [Sphingobacteriaceae bacterium]|nr:hypothetical protein [Sphingobacteriaceae bacterium]
MKKFVIILVSVLSAQLYSCQTNTAQKTESKESKPMETSYKKPMKSGKNN